MPRPTALPVPFPRNRVPPWHAEPVIQDDGSITIPSQYDSGELAAYCGEPLSTIALRSVYHANCRLRDTIEDARFLVIAAERVRADVRSSIIMRCISQSRGGRGVADRLALGEIGAVWRHVFGRVALAAPGH